MLKNPFRYRGLATAELEGIPYPVASAAVPRALLSFCPVAQETPLVRSPQLALAASVEQVWVKDERTRMGLGSFKALGAAFAIARAVPEGMRERPSEALKDRVFVAASAGNHGLSVAAGARVFGAHAVIYLARTVPEGFAQRLRGLGAEVVRAGDVYEESMQAAKEAAAARGWTLLSDSSWPGYTEAPLDVMEGYTVMAAEAVEALEAPPTHVVLQAGVGGLAAAVAAHIRAAYGDGPQIIIVEPEAAPALHDSIQAGAPVQTTGPDSTMGRLDCKEPSLIALKGLARDADAFALISDEAVAAQLPVLAEAGLASSPSGGAGLAALLAGVAEMPPEARVLTFLSEGPDP